MAKHILVVLSNAVEGTDAEFNDWYTNTHLGDILALKGFEAAQRFELAGVQLNPDADSPYRYLAFYEIETDDLKETANELLGGVARGMEISPTLDMDRTVAWLFSPVTQRVEAVKA